MLESNFTARIRKGLDYSVKLAGGSFQSRGLPDIVAVLDNYTLFLEMKCKTLSIDKDRALRSNDGFGTSSSYLGITSGQNSVLRKLTNAYDTVSLCRIGVLRGLIQEGSFVLQFWKPLIESRQGWRLRKEESWSKFPVITGAIVSSVLSIPGR